MTTAQVVETSVTVNNNSPIQDYVHPDDQTQPPFEMTPGFKPFTKKVLFASGESAKEKCFQSGFKKRDNSSTLYIAVSRIEKFCTTKFYTKKSCICSCKK